MAFLDYGAVVKKNGKIITNPFGDLFQNYSSFTYESNDNWETIKDDSVVTFKHTSSLKYEDNHFIDVDPYDEEEQTSLCGNYFAVIGDPECAIAFYKTYCSIALNKIVDNRPVNQGINRTYYGIEGNYDTKKPLKIDCKLVRQFKVKRFSPNTDYNIYLARFYYKDDVYEVLYGYGIDPNPYNLYGKGSYYYGTYNWDTRRKQIHKKNKNLLKKIEYWYTR